MCHSQVRPVSSVLGPRGGHSPGSASPLDLSHREPSFPRSISALPKKSDRAEVFLALGGLRTLISLVQIHSIRSSPAQCNSARLHTTQSGTFYSYWWTLKNSDRAEVYLVFLALTHTSNTLSMGRLTCIMVHGKGSTTALDFIHYNKVPFIVLYELWQNQTERSCTWVSSPDAHLKCAVYRLFDMYFRSHAGKAAPLA